MTSTQDVNLGTLVDGGEAVKVQVRKPEVSREKSSCDMMCLPHLALTLLCGSKMPMMSGTFSLLDCQHFLIQCIACGCKEVSLCRSGAYFLPLAPGWVRTMANTTHISCGAGSRADRRGDTGVICFCQRHRNSSPTPPGADTTSGHSLAGHRRGMHSCCDYLPPQRKASL